MRPNDKYENLLLALLEQQNFVDTPESYPIGLVLDPSSACQLNCMFCRIHSKAPTLSGRDEGLMRAKTLMNLSVFERIVDELGKYLFSVWLCNWGEPLLNPHLADMVRMLKDAKVDNVGFSSNLSMELSDEKIEALVSAGLDSITVSIDGITQESYSKYQVRGDLALALANMERFVEAKRRHGVSRPYIVWQFLVFSHNENEVAHAKERAEKIGVDFRPLAPIVDLVNYPEWLSSLDEYVMPKYRKGPQSAPPTMDEELSVLARRNYKGCDYHYLIGTINANGSVSPCCSIAKEEDDFGSLNKATFSDIWNNQMFRSARRYVRSSGANESVSTACSNCLWPEVANMGQGSIGDAFLYSPVEVREKAGRLLPRHPVVREMIENQHREALRQKEIVITELQEELADIGARRPHPQVDTVAALQQQVASYQEALQRNERCLQEARSSIALKEAALYEIYASGGWKALAKYYGMRDRILGPRSIRGNLARRIRNAFRGR